MRLALISVCGFFVLGTAGVAATADDLIAEASGLLAQRDDLSIMEQCIALYEEALSARSEDQELLVALAQLWHEHAALLERAGRTRSEWIASLKNAADYACQAMALESYIDLERMSVAQLRDHIADVESAGALLWAADSWGKILDTNRGHALRVNGESKMRALYQRLVQVDERYFGAAGYRGLGALEAELATFPLFGGWLGSVDQARAHFERAMALAPDYLMNYVEYADKLAVPLRQWDLLEDLLYHVLEAPLDPEPFWNGIAKRDAREILQRSGRVLPPES